MNRRTIASFGAALALLSGSLLQSQAADPVSATPRAICGPNARPETGTQGRVSSADHASGAAALGFTCNTEAVGSIEYPNASNGGQGGFKTFRYIDDAGRECAFYDTTLLFPLSATRLPDARLTGVHVLDMSDPANPTHTASLLTPAMQSPHESLSLNTERGLLAAGMGYPTFNPGFVDIYDVSADCREPQLMSSTPLGILGHEGNFSPDGNTLWITSTGGRTMTALDVTDPTLPRIIWRSIGEYSIHGLMVSDDGTRLYGADTGLPGLTIFDVSEVQARTADPAVRIVSRLTWPNVSIPQQPIPVTIDGQPYLVEVDEYARNAAVDQNTPVGAARIIDISDEAHPFVASEIRLEVHQPANRTADQQSDPGANFNLQGYAGHYCAVPQRAEPGIVACSFIVSGLRVFDIRDALAPREVAYFNAPVTPNLHNTLGSGGFRASNFAMSAPAFAPERNEIWYSDGNRGFYNVRVTNDAWPAA